MLIKARSDGIGCGWDGSSDGWADADALSCCAHSTAVLAAVLRQAAMALAAAEWQQRRLGWRLTLSAFAHAQQRCLQRCLGMPRIGCGRMAAVTTGLAFDAPSFGARAIAVL